MPYIGVCPPRHHPDAGVLTWGAGSGSGGAWLGRERRWGGWRGAAAARRGPAGGGAAVPSRGGSSPSGTRPCGRWPSARPPARQSPCRGPAPRAAGEQSGSARATAGRGVRKHPPGHLPPKTPPGRGDGAPPTLQVSRRVQIFLVSGFSTPHCRFRSHSLPAGRGRQRDAGGPGGPGGAGPSCVVGGTSALSPPCLAPVEVSTGVDGGMRAGGNSGGWGGHGLTSSCGLGGLCGSSQPGMEMETPPLLGVRGHSIPSRGKTALRGP